MRTPAALVPAALLAVSCAGTRPGPAPRVVTGSTMLAELVRDVSGGAAQARTLVPPGACPGHFDASPADLLALAEAGLFLRHPFQGFVDERLLRMGLDGLSITVVEHEGALTVPSNYVRAARIVAGALEDRLPQGVLEENLRRVERDAQEVEREARALLKGRAAPVMASMLQKEFLSWLGLRVVGEFDRRESSPADFAGLVRAGREEGVAIVVGNVQRGDKEASALAGELGARCVMLSNFPGTAPGNATWRGLVLWNARRIAEGLGNR